MSMDNIMSSLGGITESLGGGAVIFDGMAKAVKYHIVEPAGAKGGNEFNETDGIIAEEKKVMGIIVRCGLIVDSIQVLYEGEERGSIHGSNTGGGEHIIHFDRGDGLAVIEGDYGISFGGPGGAVSNLVIKSKKGKSYGPFGSGRSGSVFNLSVPKTGEFAGLCGYAGAGGNGGYLAGLGLIYY